MPIIVNLDVMMAKRKLTLSELCAKTGLNIASMSILKTGKAKGISYSSLDLICTALECTPGDLLEQVSEEEYFKLMGKKWEWKTYNRK
jgi:putative transcriptional regulator